MGKGTRAAMLIMALMGAGAAVGVTIAPAQSAAPSWNCRASVVRVEDPILGRTEPIVANGNADPAMPDRASCVSDNTSLPSIDLLAPDVNVDLPTAITKIDPSDTASRELRTNTATASATKVLVNGLVSADGIQSTVQATCGPAGTPVFTGSSNVVNLEIAGQAVPVDDLLDGVATMALNPTTLALIEVNKVVTTPTSRTQTALRVELVPALGPPILTVVAGETKASATGTDVCTAPPPPPTVTHTTTVAGPTTATTVPGPTTTQTTTVPGPTTTQTKPVIVPGPTTAPTTGASTTTAKVDVNGVNGGCGRLTMFFANNRKKTLGVPFGRERVVTRGRIVSCGGKGIRRARIDVYHVIGGKKRLVKTGLRSREFGRLTLILPRNLFTRKLQFVYRPDLNSARVGSRLTLQINVRSNTGRLITRAPARQGKPTF